MENEPLINEEDTSSIEKLWKTIILTIFEKLHHPISDEGVTYINRVIAVSLVIILTINPIKIPSTDIEFRLSWLIPLGFLLLLIITEFSIFDKVKPTLGLLLSRRDARFNAIISGEKSEKTIKIYFSETKFKPQQYEKIIDTLIKQDKFTEALQRKIILTPKRLNADIRLILKNSFISNSKHWLPSQVSTFLCINKECYKLDTEFLDNLLKHYPKSSVGIAIGISQASRIDNELIDAGISFNKSKFWPLKKILKWSFILLFFYTLGSIVSEYHNALGIILNGTLTEDQKGGFNILLIIFLIFIFAKIYYYIKRKLVYYSVKSSVKSLKLTDRELDDIKNDFAKIF